MVFFKNKPVHTIGGKKKGKREKYVCFDGVLVTRETILKSKQKKGKKKEIKLIPFVHNNYLRCYKQFALNQMFFFFFFFQLKSHKKKKNHSEQSLIFC